MWNYADVANTVWDIPYFLWLLIKTQKLISGNEIIL